MALVVEDGSGKSNAQSYISVADAETYHSEHEDPTTWRNALDADRERALKLATQYIDSKFQYRWLGIKTDSSQALDWPRTGAVDPNGYYIEADAVPQALKDATAELAERYLADSTTGLTPDETTAGSIRREKIKAGAVEYEVEYSGGRSEQTYYTLVERILAELVSRAEEMGRA